MAYVTFILTPLFPTKSHHHGEAVFTSVTDNISIYKLSFVSINSKVILQCLKWIYCIPQQV